MIGFGVSAQSVVGQRIWTNVPDIDEYVNRIEHNKHPMNVCTTMTKRQEMLRVIIRGFKACYIDKNDFYNRFGIEVYDVFKEQLDYLIDKGWVKESEFCFELTREGQVFDRDVYTVFYTKEDMEAPQKKGEVWLGLSLSPEEENEEFKLPKTTLGGAELKD